jgi:hypothetical protein
VATVLAVCQACDLQRGRIPAGNHQVVVGKAPAAPITAEGIEAARLRAFGPAGAAR